MHISTKVEYALLAVGHLAKYGNDDFVTIPSIAKKYDFPHSHLSKPLQQLVKANILKNKIGTKGGFKLARPANEISIMDIIEAIDSSWEQMKVIGQICKQEPFMRNMETACEDILEKTKGMLRKTKISKMIK